jgi:hypothetical protein
MMWIDYSYDEDYDGKTVKRKRKYPSYGKSSEVPHFALTMVFTRKNQLVKALKMYGLFTKMSIRFTESDRVREICG